MFSQYCPSSVSNLYYTDALREYYNENGGILPKTQNIRYYYGSRNKGAFFADKLIFEEGAGNLQVVLKYNDSALDKVSNFYSCDALTPGPGLFTYKLFAYTGNDENGNATGRTYDTSATVYDSVWFYNYEKAVFDGMDFTDVKWIEVDIYLKGKDEVFSSIIIYENNESFSYFSDYKLSSTEKLK